MTQVFLTYVAPEDRLLLEFEVPPIRPAFWITRAASRTLWVALAKAVEACGVPPTAHQAVRDMAVASRHQEAARAAPVTASPVRTWRERDARLVVRCEAKPVGSERVSLALLDGNNDGQRLDLPIKLVHQLMELLRSGVENARWDMKLQLPSLQRATAVDAALPTTRH